MRARRRPLTADDFVVQSSSIPDIGQGLFARRSIRRGETLGWYTGAVVSDDEVEVRPHVDSHYIFWVCRDHWIVADDDAGCYGKYINHSDRPNVRFVVSTRWKTVRIEALRGIGAGEEIFADYGPYFWELSDQTKR
jgi:SET domain-containing protein